MSGDTLLDCKIAAFRRISSGDELYLKVLESSLTDRERLTFEVKNYLEGCLLCKYSPSLVGRFLVDNPDELVVSLKNDLLIKELRLILSKIRSDYFFHHNCIFGEKECIDLQAMGDMIQVVEKGYPPDSLMADETEVFLHQGSVFKFVIPVDRDIRINRLICYQSFSAYLDVSYC